MEKALYKILHGLNRIRKWGVGYSLEIVHHFLLPDIVSSYLRWTRTMRNNRYSASRWTSVAVTTPSSSEPPRRHTSVDFCKRRKNTRWTRLMKWHFVFFQVDIFWNETPGGANNLLPIQKQSECFLRPNPFKGHLFQDNILKLALKWSFRKWPAL